MVGETLTLELRGKFFVDRVAMTFRLDLLACCSVLVLNISTVRVVASDAIGAAA
jgi:hypothetical protein